MFENLKEKLLERTKKNAVKSEMSWKDKKGIIHTEKVYMKRNSLPIIGDWARIYLPVNEDMSWNFPNLIFGGKKNLIKLLTIFVLLGLVFYWTMGVIGDAREYMNGSKYVIMEKEEFWLSCSPRAMPSNINLEELNTTIQVYKSKG